MPGPCTSKDKGQEIQAGFQLCAAAPAPLIRINVRGGFDIPHLSKVVAESRSWQSRSRSLGVLYRACSMDWSNLRMVSGNP